MRAMRLLLCTLLLTAPTLSADKKEWAKGIPYTTDWKAAIKEAKNTGKMILIYNGWQREKI